MLPKIAAEVSAPIAQTNKITMVSNGTGPVGAANVTREVSPTASMPINQLGSRGLSSHNLELLKL